MNSENLPAVAAGLRTAASAAAAAGVPELAAAAAVEMSANLV